jgi:hypothetical protein
MRTYDFTLPESRSSSDAARVSPDGENGWDAYDSWLEDLHQELSEERCPLPRELVPF